MELYNAVRNDAPVYHDGLWGMATLELITGIMESSRTGRDVQLTHQVPMSPDYGLCCVPPPLLRERVSRPAGALG